VVVKLVSNAFCKASYAEVSVAIFMIMAFVESIKRVTSDLTSIKLFIGYNHQYNSHKEVRINGN
jgi:hypothetical protein